MSPQNVFPGIVYGVAAVAVLVTVVATVFFILTLRKALLRCSYENRHISPGLLWLLLVPLFGMIWNFFVVIRVSKSLESEFKARNIQSDPDPGKNIGLAYSVLDVLTLVKVISGFAGIAALIIWIIYWVKIAGYSRRLSTEAELQPA